MPFTGIRPVLFSEDRDPDLAVMPTLAVCHTQAVQLNTLSPVLRQVLQISYYNLLSTVIVRLDDPGQMN